MIMFEVLKHILNGQNQFASGGLLLMVLGSIGVFLRGLPEQLWSWLVEQTTMMITVKDDDDSFVWVKEWFLEQKFLKRIRRVDLDTTLRGAEMALIPAPGRPVPRHRNLKRPKVALQTLAARPVSAVPRIVTIHGMLLITQMRRQFRLHRTLDDRLGQLLQQPVLTSYVRRRLAPRQQLVNQILRLLHTIPFYQRRSFTQNDLHPPVQGSGALLFAQGQRCSLVHRKRS